jgi:hypothetical protein
MQANAVAPTVSSITNSDTSDDSGSVAGGFTVTIAGSGFGTSGSPLVTAAKIGDIALTNLSVASDISLTADVPSQILTNRVIGRYPVVVTTDADSTDAVYFSFYPVVDSTYAAIQQTDVIKLGSLFSRTQRQPITRSASAPYVVTGTDSLSGETYSYITNYDYLGDLFDGNPLDCRDGVDPGEEEPCGAYLHEPDLGEEVHPGSLDPVVGDNSDGDPTSLDGSNNLEVEKDFVINLDVTSSADPRNYADRPTNVTTPSGSVNFNEFLGGRTVTELYSDLDCGPGLDGDDRDDLSPSNLFDSGDGDGEKYTFCAGFGPDIYSEPFVANAGTSLAYEWAAVGDSDDYAFYSFLVKVDESTGAIPTSSTTENHEIVEYVSGSQEGASSWNTSTADVSENGTYRFRFINGSFDGTGGYKLGSLFYLGSVFQAGDTNTISFGEFDDRIVQDSDTFVVAGSSTAGGQLTVSSLTTSECTVASLNTNPPTYTVTVVATDNTCILQATQGATGQYAPAASVITAFEMLSSASTPGAPTLTSAVLTSSEASLSWTAGPTGGTAITNYEYSVDNGSNWVTLDPAQTTTSHTVTGLTAGTTYNFRVRAVNAQGVGSESNVLARTYQDSSTPAPYTGPLITDIGEDNIAAPYQTYGGQTVRVDGERLSGVTKVLIDGKEGTVVSTADDHFMMIAPEGLTPGIYNLEVESSLGNLTYLDGFVVTDASANFSAANAICAGVEPSWWTQRISDTQAKAYIKCPAVGEKYRILQQTGGSGEYTSIFAKTLTDENDTTQVFNEFGRYIVRTIDLEDINRIRIRVDDVELWKARYNNPPTGVVTY